MCEFVKFLKQLSIYIVYWLGEAQYHVVEIL